MGTIATTIKVDADARAAVAGLKPLTSSLDKITEEAKDAEKALKDIDKSHQIDIDDDAINNVQREIKRLRDQVREDLRLDINADTKTAVRRINELQRVARNLDQDTVQMHVNVDVDKSGISRLTSGFQAIGTAAQKVPGILRAVGSIASVGTLGLSAVAVGVGGLVLESLKLSDSLAQAKIAFTQFLGSGAKANKFLSDLQQFAAHTPFEFPELVEASKTLLAFGINSKDIIPIMTSLGDAAALTGGQVSDLTTIWGQMQAKGKVANEELLQLTEHGIPAYKILADKMHKPVSEIQDMASKGKLLSNTTLPLLKQGLDETFGGGMAKQAKTLSGMFSTMQDTLKSLGTQLGQAFTPVVSEQIGKLTGKLQEWATWATENKETIAQTFGRWAGAALDFAADMAKAAQGVIESMAAVLDAMSVSTKIPGFAKFIGLLNPAAGAAFALGRNLDFSEAAGDLRKVGGELGNVYDGLHDSADAARKTGNDVGKSFRQSDKLAKFNNDIKEAKGHVADLNKQPPTIEVRLKADAALDQLHHLEAERDAFVQSKKQAEIKVKLGDARARLKNIGQALHDLGTQVQTPQVKAEIKEWTRKYKKVLANVKYLESLQVKPKINPQLYKPHVINGELTEIATPKKKAGGRKAKFQAVLDPTSKTYVIDTLRAIANPGGEPRHAKIKASADKASLDATNIAINHVARNRTATITVNTVTGTGGGPGSYPPGPTGRAVAPSTQLMLAGATQALSAPPATPWFSPAAAATAAARQAARAVPAPAPVPVRMAPRQTPVAVYLDGVEIANRLELRRGLAAAESVRRTA